MKTTKESSLQVLKEIRPVLAEFDNYTNDALYELLTKFAAEKEYKNGAVLWPVRTALSGKPMTPCGATELLEVLGKEESLSRIDKAIENRSRILYLYSESWKPGWDRHQKNIFDGAIDAIASL